MDEASLLSIQNRLMDNFWVAFSALDDVKILESGIELSKEL
jgi:hypothetical protein